MTRILREVRECLSADDCLVWTQVIKAVVPIGERHQKSLKTQNSWGERHVVSVTSTLSVGHNALEELKREYSRFGHSADSERFEDPRTDHRTVSRLRRGRLSIDSSIDLHGLGRTRAHMVLRSFVDRAWRLGLRSVLVITGKGTRANGGVGVLRAAVPLWLNEPDLRPKVLSFKYAQPRDGGEGALYLLIRRRRADSSAA